MLLLIFLVSTCLLSSIYYIYFANFVFGFISKKPAEKKFPISVIICAKNEAEKLKENIPYIVSQDHPEFEIILINDASIDETPQVIESFATKDSRVHTVHIENNEAFWSNKKYSLTLGIKRAKYPRLLFTDADCKPASNQWLTKMGNHFSESKQLVLGYGAYKKQKGFLNKLIRYETAITAIQYLSYAKSGNPYMGVGRNLGYTTHLFYKNRGFMNHMQILSGDDDLFVNEAATKKNTSICIDEAAFTISSPKKKWEDWYRQKRRHITTAKYYKKKHQTQLAIYYLSNLLFWLLVPACFIWADWKISLAIVCFRLSLQYIIIGKGCKLLKEKDLVLFLPFYEVFLICFQLIIFISNSVSKPKRWA